LIPQDTLNKLGKELQTMLQLCLVNHEEWIFNQLWQVTEGYALMSFFEVNIVHIPWAQEENEGLLRDYLVVSSRWTVLARTRERRNAA
jgi:hypothetical protein